MFAVVETGGKQYQVQEGRYVDIELLDLEPESNISIDKVVAIVAGEYSQIGQPYVENATVKGKVLSHGKEKKVTTYKMRKKKGYRLKKGHRQNFTRLLVEDIDFPNKSETLNHVQKLEEQKQNEQQEAENKIKKAKEKNLEKKQTRKETLKAQHKAKKDNAKTSKPEKTVQQPETTEVVQENQTTDNSNE